MDEWGTKAMLDPAIPTVGTDKSVRSLTGCDSGSIHGDRKARLSRVLQQDLLMALF